MNIFGQIQRWLVNSIYAYACYALYALTFLPYVNDIINDGTTKPWVGAIGLLMLVVDYWAMYYKLIRIRARAELSRIQIERKTGVNWINNPPMLMVFGLFIRMCLRVTVIMISLAAFGMPVNYGQHSSESGVFLMLILFFLEGTSFIYMYVKTRIYIEPGVDRISREEDETEEKNWRQENLHTTSVQKQNQKENLADLVLNAFAMMLYAPLWDYLNQSGVIVLKELIGNGVGAMGAFLSLGVMLGILAVFALLPLRLAYWIEDTLSQRVPESRSWIWTNFFLFSVVTYLPTISYYVNWYINDLSDTAWYTWPAWFRMVVPAVIYLLAFVIQLKLFTKKAN